MAMTMVKREGVAMVGSGRALGVGMEKEKEMLLATRKGAMVAGSGMRMGMGMGMVKLHTCRTGESCSKWQNRVVERCPRLP